MVSLRTLLPDTPHDLEITGLSVDSRKIAPGWLFAALPGSQVDGRRFIPQAIEAGASAILIPDNTEDLPDTGEALVIRAANPRLFFARMAARFYGKQPDLSAAVTGTNGKSSVVTFVRQLWSLLGHSAASVGTLGVSAPGLNISGGLTTPDPAGLHERLSELASLGVTHLAMEASSHGLDQYRLDGVNVRIAAFTNLSRDHLDYHSDMDDYLRAKMRLFSDVLTENGTAILNADIPEFDKLNTLAENCGHQVITYGKHAKDLCLLTAKPSPEGQELTLRVNDTDYTLSLKLAGYFQAENALCAAAIVMASGESAERVMPLLEKLDGVPGRMEAMGRGVYVDYAHTPGALQTVLEALRPHTDGKLAVLFGCGGDRDKGKRAEMGKIASEHADQVYVSDDNPRSEDPASIRAEIITTCPQAIEIGDRKVAIKTAITEMTAGDVLLIAGKGHETGQIVGDQILPFDDRALAQEILS